MPVLDEDTLKKYRQQFQASAAVAQPTAPQQRGGILGRVGNFAAGVGKSIAQPFQDVAEGAANAISSGNTFKQAKQVQDQSTRTITEANKLWKAGKMSKEQYINVLNGTTEALQATNVNTEDVTKKVNAKKTLAGAAQIATYAVAPGLGALKAGAPVAAKIGANAGLGGVIGGASAIENDGDISDVAQGILMGGAVGGGIGAVGAAGRGLLNRVQGRGAPPAAATEGALAPQVMAPEARQAMLQQFQSRAATARPAAPMAPPTAAAPQVVTRPGQTVLSPQRPAPAPLQPAAAPPAMAPPAAPAAPMVPNPLAQASDADLFIRNYLANAGARAPRPPAAPVAGPRPVPELSPQRTALFEELQSKTNRALQEPNMATSMHAGPQPSAVPAARPMQAPSLAPQGATAEQAAQMGLPEGYTANTIGDVFSPSGKPVTIGELQTLQQPKFLTDFEQGNLVTRQRIAAAHPGDARVNAPELFPGGATEAAPELGGNILQKAGRSMNQAGVRVQTKASPFGARRERELGDFLRAEGLLKAGSNPEGIYRQLPSKMTEYQGQINKLIANDTTTIASADLKAEIRTALSKDNLIRGAGKKQSEIANNINKIIDKSAGPGGNLKPSQIYQIKQMLNDDLDAAYKRMGKGAPLNEADQTAMTARNIINDKLPAAARALGKKESNLHDLATILDSARKLNMNLPKFLYFFLPHFRGSTGTAHVMESLYTSIGTPLEKMGNALAGVSSGAPGGGAGMLSRVAGRAGGGVSSALETPAGAMAAPLAAGGVVNAPEMPEMPQEQQVPEEDPMMQPGADGGFGDFSQMDSMMGGQAEEPAPDNPYGLTAAKVQDIMLQDLIQTGGANNAQLSKMYSILKEQEEAAKPQSMSQTAVNQINTIQRATSGLDAIEAAFGKTRNTGKGLLSKVQSSPLGNFTGGGGVQEVNKAIQANLTSIAQALGMGTSNRELEALSAQLPNTSDTRKSAQAKIGVIRGQIQQYLNQYLTNQSNFIQPNNQTLDALAQMSAGGLQV